MYKIIIFAALSMVLSAGAHAAKIYKYTDENGVVRFTDRPPAEVEEIEASKIEMRLDNEKRMFGDVYVREDAGGRPSLTVVNEYHGPVQVALKVDCQHCELTSPGDVVHMVIPADSEKVGARLRPSRANWQAEYDLQVVIGDPDALPREDIQIGLPFPANTFYLVSQGFNGRFSHQHEQSFYAYDFVLPLGTGVLAARDGVVMGVVQNYTEAGTAPEYADKANVAYVLHDDGSIAMYAHLDMHSVMVKPGDRVARGDILARSGNTGFSTGPHLHFSLLKNNNGVLESIPYSFVTDKGESFTPVAGEEIKWMPWSPIQRRVAQGYESEYELGLVELSEAKTARTDNEQEDVKSETLFDRMKAYLKTK